MKKNNSNVIDGLPPPPSGRSGWPWTISAMKFPSLTRSRNCWPKICIVTPSFNQGIFLEETIRSVLLQGYPNLEYIIMDGGSSDNSLEIIKKYEPWLKYWVSEKDGGQSEAIAKGFDMTSSDIIGWLNSDDFLLSGSLKEVGSRFAANSDLNLLVGGGIIVNENGKLLRKMYSFPQNYESLLSIGQYMVQMSSFWKKKIYHEVGGIDKSLKFCFDYDLFIRLAKRNNTEGTDSILSAFRIHSESKTSTIWENVALPEIETVKQRYFSSTLTKEYYAELSKIYTKKYHLNIRANIIKDIYRDYKYFLVQLKKKLSFKV